MAANDQPSEIGLIGLAVMGQNLALNIADHGFRISVYNRTTEKMEAFVDSHPDTPGGLVGCATLEALVASLKRPRKLIVMVKAGSGTDAVIEQLAPLLDEGDILIDGGNSKWTDTIAREQRLAERGLRFIGSGISGGEEGARFGPSLMPGGQEDAWKALEPVWTAIAAKVDPDTGKPLLGAKPGKPIEGGEPCTAYIGPDGAGHYVKMMHNGIEYGDMQMICEAYDLMQRLAGMRPAEIGQTFARWNEGVLDSYLVEITADVLQQTDPVTGEPFVDVVLDAAGQKGTGKWTSINALDMGVPAPTIAEAVFARCISAFKEERVEATKILAGPDSDPESDPAREQVAEEEREALLEAIHDALYCAKICSYAQGFQLMRAAQAEYGWTLDFGEIAGIWRGGCIIRADFLQKITEAYRYEPELANLLLAPHFKEAIDRAQPHWRKVVALAAQQGVPAPTFAASLAYYDSYRSARLPQNLLQAQRDYFGAHTYERVDQPRGRFFHIDWPDPERPQREA
ncbi:NADP-dependent phosphogluconate dehydrogenase [Halochromatium roseum]|uniref:NADP-dependent phosphogluconate dehydrogenase n=1 Tax=Halochromatium roseum TaxID=391920 RepID=UPI001912D4E3|nr:NADP-dependent phosphogluconate dehydrogenase [Halochromatium roseum]MBK5942034.1 phosphogluconate dehydrogenase (NADP(+)-dependent, decarboxylating) [Halochromatium roseum]